MSQLAFCDQMLVFLPLRSQSSSKISKVVTKPRRYWQLRFASFSARSSEHLLSPRNTSQRRPPWLLGLPAAHLLGGKPPAFLSEVLPRHQFSFQLGRDVLHPPTQQRSSGHFSTKGECFFTCWELITNLGSSSPQSICDRQPDTESRALGFFKEQNWCFKSDNLQIFFETIAAKGGKSNPFDKIKVDLAKPGGGSYGKYYSLTALKDPRIGKVANSHAHALVSCT